MTMTMPKPYWAMYTAAGNRAAEALYNRLVKYAAKDLTDTELAKVALAAFNKTALKHAEIFDTEPRDMILERVEKLTGRAIYL